MTTAILLCETCGGRKPFPLNDQELADIRFGKHISKFCNTCRNNTNWAFATEERRAGADRRKPADRRSFF